MAALTDTPRWYDALRLALDEFVLALPFLPQVGEAAGGRVGDGLLKAFHILGHHQLGGADDQGALGEAHVAFEGVDLVAIVDGDPVVIVRDGKVLRDRLRRELITDSDVTAAARQAGIDELADVRLAILEPNGTISVFPRSAPAPRP